MSEARELPRRIVVAGDGQLGVLAAVALRQALPASEVLVIGTPPDGAAIADMMPTALSFTSRLHDRLGLAEELLVTRAGGSHRLAVEWRGWGGEGHRAVTSLGGAVDPALKSVFAREWGGGPRNAATGTGVYSINEALVTAGRFMPPDGNPDSPLSDVDYALRWNMPAYRDLLIALAAQLGVKHVAGAIDAVQPDAEGGLQAVRVVGGGEIAADLFIDCTGPQAALASKLPGARQIDWGAMLPIRELVFARPRPVELALSDRIELTAQGWVSQFHGRDALVRMAALVERGGDAVAETLLGNEVSFAVPLEPGRLEDAWRGNVIALGDSAASFEPLGWLNLDFAHRQIGLLLELLPGLTINPLERTEFNRRSALMADRARDYVAACYAAPAARQVYPDLARSDELALVLDQFARRGRMPFLEETPLSAQEWVTQLHALGIPAGEGLLSEAADPAQAERARQAFAAKCRAALDAAPPYAGWLEMVLRSS